MAYNSANRSERLLQNRRFTTDGNTLTQEAFTQVLDLGVSEIYLDTAFIPTGSSQIAYSGSSQDQRIISASIVSPSIVVNLPIAKYWNRKKMKPAGDGTRQVYYFTLSNPSSPTNSVASDQLIESDQLTNFISPKYISIPADASNNTEANPPGYKVQVYKSTSATAAGITESAITDDNYVFDYKTGVLAWVTGQAPASNQYVYISAYQYIGRTLATQQVAGYSGSFSGSFQGNINTTGLLTGTVVGALSGSASGSFQGSATGLFSGSFQGTSTGSFSGLVTGVGSGSFSGSFHGNGAGLTNLPAASIVGLNLSQTATGSVSASVLPGATSFQIVSGSSTLLSLTNTGNLTVSGSEFIGNNITAAGNLIVTGSTIVNNTLTVNNNTTVAGVLTVQSSSSLKDTTVTGSMTVTQNLTVLGTASFTSVTSSRVVVGASTITLNTNDPVVRFGGIIVTDSGSFGTDSTGSLLWDSERNHWIYENPQGGSYHGAGLMSGPRNTGSLGDEAYPAHYSVLRGQGSDHLEGSSIYSSGSKVTINKGSITGSGDVDIVGTVVITGSTLLPAADGTGASKYGLVVSQSTWHYSDNIGYPVGTNQWGYNLDGSYFNLFNQNTDTATIVRFIAGFLSASTPAPVANSRLYDGVTSAVASTSTTSQPAGYVSFNHADTTIQYLINKGFALVGQKLFYSIGGFTSAIETNSSLNYTFTNQANGTFSVSSSAVNASLLFGSGLLSENVSVSASRNWKFYDNNSFTLLYTSASQFVTTNTTLDTTNAQGLYRFQINTAAPRVIPNTYQDSRFSGLNTNYNFTSSIAFANSSSTGYYELTASLGIATGSGNYTFAPTAATQRFRIFYAPITHINSSIASTTPAGAFSTMQKLTAVSRSLSGAPYLTSATYATNITASNCFSPMYNDGTIATIGISGTGVAQTGNTTSATSAGTYNTSNVFYDGSGNLKTIGMIPTASDVVRLNSAITFTAPDGTNNFTNKSTLSPTTFTLTGTGYNRLGTTNTLATTASLYHVAGDFSQPSASGSLAYYGKADGFDNSSATFTKGSTGTENFGGETYRRNISNDVLTFTLPGTTIWNSGSRLGTKDLQVAPAKLVDPGSTSGYWYPASYGATTKYYIREIQYASGGGLGSVTVNLGTTLNAWSSTADGWSVALLLEAQKDAGSGATLLGFEVGAAAIAGPTSQTTGNQNPFASTVNVVYNPTSAVSTAYTVTLDFSKGQAVNNSNKIFIIARLNNSTYASHTVPTSLTITGA